MYVKIPHWYIILYRNFGDIILNVIYIFLDNQWQCVLPHQLLKGAWRQEMKHTMKWNWFETKTKYLQDVYCHQTKQIFFTPSIFVCIFVCSFVCGFVFIFVCIFVYIFVCTFVCTLVCIFVCIICFIFVLNSIQWLIFKNMNMKFKFNSEIYINFFASKISNEMVQWFFKDILNLN